MSTDYGKVEALVSDLWKLLESGDGADVTFVVGRRNVRFRAHSMIVAARCRLLKEDVRAHLRETRFENKSSSTKPHIRGTILEICLPDVNPAAFADVLRYMYTGKIYMSTGNAFELYSIASRIGIPRLTEIANHHLKVSSTVDGVLDLLREALRRGFEEITLHLIKFVAENCAQILQSDSFARTTAGVILHIVKQEHLNASEVEIWNAIVRWAAVHCSIPMTKTVSSMSDMERRQIVEHVKRFLRPGYLRIMNIDAETFAREVEPLGVLKPSEKLLKYRFDATKNMANFEEAFPAPCIEFLTRIRRRSYLYESSHPHACGVDEKVHVKLPSWAKQVRVEFDPRCVLGQYAELTFFEDEACTTMLSVLTDSRRKKLNGHMPQLSVRDGLKLHLPSSEFWFTFYSPQAFPARWGYKFSVLIV